MAGTFVAKAIADGQLPTTKGTLFAIPALTWAYVKNITVFNTNAATQTVLLYLNTTGTSRRIARFVLAQNEWAEYTQPRELEAGDLIEGETTTASAVDYTIDGVLET